MIFFEEICQALSLTMSAEKPLHRKRRDGGKWMRRQAGQPVPVTNPMRKALQEYVAEG
jgi:hypothetical protein